MEKQADLTREQILAMEPGIELDALVAERVFGEEVAWNSGRMDAQIATGARCDDDGVPFDFDFEQISPFSTDIGAAFEVLQKVKTWDEDKRWDFNAEMPLFAEEITPEAICKAALIATL